jgi:hypothetical protein
LGWVSVLIGLVCFAAPECSGVPDEGLAFVVWCVCVLMGHHVVGLV